jgi:hypothetical protein
MAFMLHIIGLQISRGTGQRPAWDAVALGATKKLATRQAALPLRHAAHQTLRPASSHSGRHAG